MSLLHPQLDAFIAICQHGTVHQAASQLHITQTATTARLQKLETALNTTLFIRSRRGMTPTAEGQALLRYCKACQSLEHDTLAQLTGAGDDSEVTLRIHGPSSFIRSRVLQDTQNIMQQHAQLLIHFDINDDRQGLCALQAGDADLAIVEPDQLTPEIRNKALQAEQYVLVCTQAWKKRPLKSILANERIVDFNPQDQMTYRYLQRFDLHPTPKGRHFANRTDTLVAMVANGMGYSALPLAFAQPHIDNQSIIVLNQRHVFLQPWHLAWYDRPNPPAYFSHCIDAIS